MCCFGLDSLTETFTHPTYQHAYVSKLFQTTTSYLVYCHLPSLDLLEYYLPGTKYWLSWSIGKAPTEFSILRILSKLPSHPHTLDYFYLSNYFLQDEFHFISCWCLNHCIVLWFCLLYMLSFICHLNLVLSVRYMYFHAFISTRSQR